jgi:hypothetical protein
MVDSTVFRAGISSPSETIFERGAGWVRRAALAMAAFLAFQDFFFVMVDDEAMLCLKEGSQLAEQVQVTRYIGD